MSTHPPLTEDSRRTHGGLTHLLTEDSHREGKGDRKGDRKGKSEWSPKHHVVTYVTRADRDAMMRFAGVLA